MLIVLLGIAIVYSTYDLNGRVFLRMTLNSMHESKTVYRSVV